MYVPLDMIPLIVNTNTFKNSRFQNLGTFWCTFYAYFSDYCDAVILTKVFLSL